MQSFESRWVSSSLDRAMAFVEVKLDTEVIERDLEKGVRALLDGRDGVPSGEAAARADLLSRARAELESEGVTSKPSDSADFEGGS